MKLSVSIEVQCDNAAFHDEDDPKYATENEIRQMLERHFRSVCFNVDETIALRDSNGNVVGKAIVSWNQYE
jgi:hypothetical protein